MDIPVLENENWDIRSLSLSVNAKGCWREPKYSVGIGKD